MVDAPRSSKPARRQCGHRPECVVAQSSSLILGPERRPTSLDLLRDTLLGPLHGPESTLVDLERDPGRSIASGLGISSRPRPRASRRPPTARRAVAEVPTGRLAWQSAVAAKPAGLDAGRGHRCVLNLPRYGVWSIARVIGGYRYETSRQGNDVDGSPDYGHIRDIELLTDERGIDPKREGASEALRRSMRPILRMWSLDAHRDEIERLIRT